MKEGIVFTFLWLTIFTQEERVNSGRRGKGKGKGGEGKMAEKGRWRRREDGGEGGEVTVLTFLWLTIFMSRSSLNALFAYVSF